MALWGLALWLLLLAWLQPRRAVHASLAGWLVAAAMGSAAGLVQLAGYGQSFAPWIAPSAAGVAFGNLRQPNLFATLMAIGWIACAALMRTDALRSRAFGYAVIALLAVGNAASGSRTGLLLWVLVGAALWGWSRSDSQQSLAQRSQAASGAKADASPIRSAFTPVGMTTWAWGTYVFALVLLPQLVDSDRHLLHRLTSDAPDCQSRLVLWSSMLHLIAQKPWFGWGWGELDYAHYITAYPGMRFCGLLDNAHNLPLHLAVELGMPVAVLFCAGVVRFVWRRKPWRERDPMRFGAWLILGAIGVHSLLEYPLWYGPFQMTALLCVWMVWRQPEGKGAAGATQLGRRLMQVAALALSAAAFYAAWDYHRISQLYLPAGQRSAWYAADPWTHARRSWLFADHVRFAELVTTPLTQDNAAHMAQLAEKMLHFSPEPAVVRTLIESLRLLGRDTEAGFHAQRLKDAYAGRDE
jgi:hypothetical protein